MSGVVKLKDEFSEFSEFEGEDIDFEYSYIKREFDSKYNLAYPILRESDKLSAKAIGIYLKMLSFPKTFKFSIKRLSKQFHEGERSIRNGLNELKAYGYLTVEQKSKTVNGETVFIIYTKILQKIHISKNKRKWRHNLCIWKRLSGDHLKLG